MKLLEIENLSKAYSKFKLENISFSLEEGKIMGLLGKNGAGKSTILKSILNMVEKDSGMIKMFECNFIENEIFCKKQIGVVLGGVEFYKYKKVKEITAVTRRFYKEWNEEIYEKYIKMFEIEDNKKINQLSQGMKIKYSLALALSHNAKLLILDEPTSGLDPISREEIINIFRYLVKKKERGILFSTHIISDLEKCADEITYIQKGKVILSENKEVFIKTFQKLKRSNEKNLNLEEIILRLERKESYDKFNI